MLLKLFPTLINKKPIIWLNRYLNSMIHIAVIAILFTISSIFDVGFTFYYIIIGLSVVIPSLFGNDMTAILPFAVMMNIGINKGLSEMDEKIVLGPNLIHFIIFIGIAITFFFGRLVFDLIVEKERRNRFPRFTIGYICLLLAFLLAGRFYSGHTINDTVFGLREFMTLGLFYFYCFYSIDFKKMNNNYFAYLLLFFALSVSTQILIEAIRSGIDKPLLVGWGNRSGLGGTLVACFSGVTYLIIKKHPSYTWVFTLLFLFFITMIGLTQCRGAALTSLVMAIPCLVLIFIFARPVTKITTGVLITIYTGMMIYLYFFQKDIFEECFGRLIFFDYDSWDKFSSGRITIWKTGLDQFIHNPIFGVGWYQIPNLGFPARYHNTFMQMLAATGIVGTLGYCYHRFETVFVTFKKPTLEKALAFISILCILVSSLLDCFLFNIWLGFIYSFLLAFIESRNYTHLVKYH